VALIPVGYARRAHGVGGEVAIRPMTDDPGRWVVDATFVTDEELARTLSVASVRPHRDDLLVKFRGIDDREAAEALQGVTFHVGAAQRRSLGEGEYWPDQLIGCSAVGSDRRLGTVVAVEFGAGQDRIVVETEDGKRIEVPFVDAIVDRVDLGNAQIRMSPPEGLF
jgi:16S rRNA processing protein RimM